MIFHRLMQKHQQFCAYAKEKTEKVTGASVKTEKRFYPLITRR